MGLVLIEGAPGIGKSTLAWELCRKWDEFPCMKQYSLVILLRLREKRVQKITRIADLLFSYEIEDQKPLVDEVVSFYGKGVLFILDGFDELPVALQREGFLMDLIKNEVLPECTVVVTSRPSATAKLLTSCYPQKHIEILGFTQESVEAYASSIFFSDETLESFKKYISASKNPAINSLMYVPINAAIIVQIYIQIKSSSSLPHNLTQLYTQLCLTILNKYMMIEYPSADVHKFKDLPGDLYKCFLELSKIAFEGITNQEVIFHSDSVPSNLNHFGFLDAVSTLYGGGEISYNFLHLTLQEFFAAYHISQLPDCGAALFGKYHDYPQWNVVWRFVAGLTKFCLLKSYTNCVSFLDNPKIGETFTTFFIHCLFEAQIVIDFKSTFGVEMKTCIFDSRKSIKVYAPSAPLDNFALGYCIANCTTKQSFWNVHCSGKKAKFDTFIQGLLSNSSSSGGVVKSLTIDNPPFLHDFEKKEFCFAQLHACLENSENPLNGVSSLSITNTSLGLSFLKAISYLTCLQELNVNGCELCDYLDFLQQISHSKVTSLSVVDTFLENKLTSQDRYGPRYFFQMKPGNEVPFKALLQSLIHPSSGIVHQLAIGLHDPAVTNEINSLVSLVSSPSSIQHLSMFYPKCPYSLLTSFNPNNQLTTLMLTALPYKFSIKEYSYFDDDNIPYQSWPDFSSRCCQDPETEQDTQAPAFEIFQH